MILEQFKLDGKVAVVTGAGRGIGQAYALGLAEAGADVALVDVIDMTETEYISSVGLRAFLSMQKKVNANNGKMLIRNVQDGVREVFDITGFSGLLTVEK